MGSHPLRWRSLRRRPSLYWIAVTLAAALAAATTGAVVHDAQKRAESWGASRPVAVAARDLEPGSVLTDGDVSWESRPAATLPNDTIDTGNPAGRVVLQRIVKGEPLVLARLAPDGAHGLSALLPPGSVALLIPPAERSPRLEVGDLVDVFGTDGSNGWNSSESAPGVVGEAHDPVASEAKVIELGDDGAVTVAVRREEAAATAAAILEKSAVLALIGQAS